MTQDTERWTIYVCPECGSLSGVEQPCPDVAHAYADEAPPIVERYVPASSLQEVERERDELREALERIANRSLVGHAGSPPSCSERAERAMDWKSASSERGRLLREAREEAGLTRAQLAVLAGCSMAHLGNIELGVVPKNSRVLDAAFDAIEVQKSERRPPQTGARDDSGRLPRHESG